MLSKYNHYKKRGDNIIIYNSLSDMVDEVTDKEFEYLSDTQDSTHITDDLFYRLHKKDMLVNSKLDETNKTILRYNETVFKRQLHIVLLASTDCNLICSYCYQNYDKMVISDQFNEIFIEFLKRNIINFDGVYIEWFGGEPLLAKKKIIALSNSIKIVCKQNNIPYMASMTTNGYYLSDNTARELINSGIRFFQVTLDGNESAHDELRISKNGKGSYKKITENLLKIKKNIPPKIFFRIGIRNNVSKININRSSYSFFKDHLEEDRRFSYFQYPIKDWGGDGIEEIRESLIGDDEQLIDTDKYSQFSRPISRRLCYVTKRNGLSITPDLKVYKCHHYVGKYYIEDLNLINYIGQISSKGILLDNEATEINWNVANISEKCKICQYLPNCLFDSCPLKRSSNFDNCKEQQKMIIQRKISIL